MAERYIDTCTECGKENGEVTLVDDETSLCDDCLRLLDYVDCDECGEYWAAGVATLYYLTDGRVLCENCAQELLDNEDITDDDILEIDQGD